MFAGNRNCNFLVCASVSAVTQIKFFSLDLVVVVWSVTPRIVLLLLFTELIKKFISRPPPDGVPQLSLFLCLSLSTLLVCRCFFVYIE